MHRKSDGNVHAHQPGDRQRPGWSAPPAGHRVPGGDRDRHVRSVRDIEHCECVGGRHRHLQGRAHAEAHGQEDRGQYGRRHEAGRRLPPLPRRQRGRFRPAEHDDGGLAHGERDPGPQLHRGDRRRLCFRRHDHAGGHGHQDLPITNTFKAPKLTVQKPWTIPAAAPSRPATFRSASTAPPSPTTSRSRRRWVRTR